jgi:hypothetical protein
VSTSKEMARIFGKKTLENCIPQLSWTSGKEDDWNSFISSSQNWPRA